MCTSAPVHFCRFSLDTCVWRAESAENILFDGQAAVPSFMASLDARTRVKRELRFSHVLQATLTNADGRSHAPGHPTSPQAVIGGSPTQGAPSRPAHGLSHRSAPPGKRRAEAVPFEEREHDQILGLLHADGHSAPRVQRDAHRLRTRSSDFPTCEHQHSPARAAGSAPRRSPRPGGLPTSYSSHSGWTRKRGPVTGAASRSGVRRANDAMHASNGGEHSCSPPSAASRPQRSSAEALLLPVHPLSWAMLATTARRRTSRLCSRISSRFTFAASRG